MATELQINLIRRDGGTQPRQQVDPAVVEGYRDRMADGDKFPPVDVFYDGTDYWLADGFHRVGAAALKGRATIEATVHQGDKSDAVWFSFAANKANGLHRTNADKERAVKAALAHPRSAKLSDRQIAEHVGVNDKTVAKYRASIIGNSEDVPRTVTRNGTTYQMNTGKIGQKPAPSPIPAVKQAVIASTAPAAARTSPVASPEPEERDESSARVPAHDSPKPAKQPVANHPNAMKPVRQVGAPEASTNLSIPHDPARAAAFLADIFGVDYVARLATAITSYLEGKESSCSQ